MSGHSRRLVMSLVCAGMCLSWAGCGGGRPPHPCQGATCVASATTFLYLTALDDISGFTLATSGGPTSFQSLSGPNQSIGMVADSSAKFLFVSDFENATVEAFTINQSSGVLVPVSGSPSPAGSAPDTGGIAVDPSTRFLYATLLNSDAVAGFSIN